MVPREAVILRRVEVLLREALVHRVDMVLRAAHHREVVIHRQVALPQVDLVLRVADMAHLLQEVDLVRQDRRDLGLRRAARSTRHSRLF
jgi:hypothetical protein